jgi:hypothetical protein
MKSIYRVYVSIFNDDEELDGRYSPLIISLSNQSTATNDHQQPMYFTSNKLPNEFIRKDHIQHIKLTGKLTQRSAERLLTNHWQNSIAQGFIDIKVSIIDLQVYLSPSLK